MEYRLDQQVAIVTGAGQGLGAAIARVLAGAGARIAVNDLNPDRAQRVAQAIQDSGGQALAVTADVSSKFQCVHLIETTRAEWGRLDILVNNASVEPHVSILKMDEWDWNRCLDVNLKGTFFMSQLCGRVMADENAERGGVIINIAAAAGVKMPLADRAAYCASKAGVVGFARECAREFAQYGIRVNTILPGLMDTPRTALRGGDEADRRRQWEAQLPMGRLGQAEEAAAVVLFLSSQASSYMTGATLTVAGGLVMD
ncbi:MAG: SDR family NAD(P)-dependent oxidoreductase [Candidatus Promineifilaceae bacterium]|nr:SDR family NAD(P)-dependent oxidoreductase [Candidatus Promineifilaceae bacterium]